MSHWSFAWVRLLIWHKYSITFCHICRYLLFGDVSSKSADVLSKPEVWWTFNCLTLSLSLFSYFSCPLWGGILFYNSLLKQNMVLQVTDFFARLIQRVSPKSYQQACAEVNVTVKFLRNFSGDQVRFNESSWSMVFVVILLIWLLEQLFWGQP